MQEEGCVDLAALNGRVGKIQEIAEIEREHVDHLNGGAVGTDGAERLEVGFAPLGGQDDELPHACPLLP